MPSAKAKRTKAAKGTKAAKVMAGHSSTTLTARRYKEELLARLLPAKAIAAAASTAPATADAGTSRAGLRAVPVGHNLVGLGYGPKVSAGAATSDLALRVYVRTKLPRFDLTPRSEVPTRLEDGTPTDVVEVGDIWAARPVLGGASIGHRLVTAGTLGCVVRRGSGTRHFILSNNHILAAENSGAVGDEVLEPGPLDGGTVPIARLFDFEPLAFPGPNAIDAAIAELLDTADVDPAIGKIGPVARPPAAAVLYESVRKSGRTTQHTIGVVMDLSADVRVQYTRGIAEFEDQIAVHGVGGDFARRGDSGALVVDAVSRAAVGLLFAVASGVTFVNPIAPVLQRFGVSIV